MMDTEKKPNKTAETEALSDEKLENISGGIIRRNQEEGGSSTRPEPKEFNITARVEKL